MSKRSWGQRRAPLDLDKLNDSLKQDREELKRTLSDFKQTSEDFKEEFRSAENEGNNQEMARLTSELKDSADSLKAEELSCQAKQLREKLDNQMQLEVDAGHQAADLHSTEQHEAAQTGSNQDNKIDDFFDELLDSLDELNHYIDDFLE